MEYITENMKSMNMCNSSNNEEEELDGIYQYFSFITLYLYRMLYCS